MGFIKNIVTSQLIDVIEWKDDSQDTMVYRYDMNGKEIMMGAQLTVRESQVAVFVNEGQLADVFQPGRHELTTQNMPIMTALKSWKFGFNSPFKSDVYFVNTKQFLDRKWGTSNPVMMRDTEFGMIRIRAFGIYSFKVSDPTAFLKEVFGTSGLFTVDGVEGQIKRTVVSGLSDALAESKIPALDMAANYQELGDYVLKALNPKIEALGLTLSSFVIENISLPEEVEKSIDKRTSMGVVGDLNKYAQFQAAEAMREAANNPGGMAGMGVGMGAGAAMGQMFTQSMQQPSAVPSASQPSQPSAVPSASQPSQPSAVPSASQPSAVPSASQPSQPSAVLTPSADPAQSAAAPCVACGKPITAGSRFCPECGAAQATKAVCGGCGAELTPEAKFCPACGQAVQ